MGKQIKEGSSVVYGDVKGVVTYSSDNLVVIMQKDGTEFILYNEEVARSEYGDDWHWGDMMDVTSIEPSGFSPSEKYQEEIRPIKEMLENKDKGE